MASNIRVVYAHEFIRATEEGTFDLEESKRLLREVALAETVLQDFDVLLDTRKAHSVLSLEDLLEMVSELYTLDHPYSRKTAVLVPRQRLDYAEFFAKAAQDRGFQVRAFVSKGDALEWLIPELAPEVPR